LKFDELDRFDEDQNMSLNIAELMGKMPAAFLPEKAAGMEAVLQFHFTGKETGEWHATIKNGKCTVGQGAFPSPSLTFTADSEDFLKIFRGELDGMQAFMQGSLGFTGDMNLALKLLSVFEID
jgi:putative sterol carrier protein